MKGRAMKPEELIEYGFSEYGFSESELNKTYFIRGRKELLLLAQKIEYVNDDLNELLTNHLDFRFDCWIKAHPIISKKIDTIDLTEYEYQFTGSSLPYFLDGDGIEEIKRKLLKEELEKMIKYMEKYFNEVKRANPPT